MSKQVCTQCNKEIQPGEKVLTAMESPWHTGCFCCAKCKEPFSGSVKLIPGVGAYHPDCFVCDTCGCTLTGRYSIHPKTEKPSCAKCVDQFVRVDKFVKKGGYNKEDSSDEESGKECKKCGEPIEAGTAKKVPNVGSFHPECFVCDTCGCELSKKYFTHPTTKMPNCKPCLDKFVAEFNGPKHDCVKCGKKIQSGAIEIPNVGIMHSDCLICDTCGCVLGGKLHKGRFSVLPDSKEPVCKPCVIKFHGGNVERDNCTLCGKSLKGFAVLDVPDAGIMHSKCFVCDTCGDRLTLEYETNPRTKVPNCAQCYLREVKE